MTAYKKYFYKERELNKIDWEEYMEIFDYYPVLEFDATGEGIGKKEVIEINKKKAPYFNKKLLHIYVKLQKEIKDYSFSVLEETSDGRYIVYESLGNPEEKVKIEQEIREIPAPDQSIYKIFNTMDDLQVKEK